MALLLRGVGRLQEFPYTSHLGGTVHLSLWFWLAVAFLLVVGITIVILMFIILAAAAVIVDFIIDDVAAVKHAVSHCIEGRFPISFLHLLGFTFVVIVIVVVCDIIAAL